MTKHIVLSRKKVTYSARFHELFRFGRKRNIRIWGVCHGQLYIRTTHCTFTRKVIVAGAYSPETEDKNLLNMSHIVLSREKLLPICICTKAQLISE